jgi:hypothetical protein
VNKAADTAAQAAAKRERRMTAADLTIKAKKAQAARRDEDAD